MSCGADDCRLVQQQQYDVCCGVVVQERLDFAMKEIIFDLLCVGKSYKTVFFPEVSLLLLLGSSNCLELIVYYSLYC